VPLSEQTDSRLFKMGPESSRKCMTHDQCKARATVMFCLLRRLLLICSCVEKLAFD